MKILKLTPILLLFALTFTSCNSDDETDEFWRGISISNNFKSTAFVFYSTEIGTCDEHGENNLEAVLKSNINTCLLFPRSTYLLNST